MVKLFKSTGADQLHIANGGVFLDKNSDDDCPLVPRQGSSNGPASLRMPQDHLFAGDERLARMILAFDQLPATEKDKLLKALEDT